VGESETLSTRILDFDTNIGLFADECIIYRKITNKHDLEKLQKDLDTLGKWAVEKWVKINPGKYNAIRLTRYRVKFHWVTLLVTKKSGIEQL
jgi:hypothetical protein